MPPFLRAKKMEGRVKWLDAKIRAIKPSHVIELFKLVYETAMDEGLSRGERMDAAKFYLEQAVGKASSKLEVENTTNTQTAEDRVRMAMVAAGLIQNLQQQQLPMPVVTDLPIEGEVVDGGGTGTIPGSGEVLPGGTSEEGGGGAGGGGSPEEGRPTSDGTPLLRDGTEPEAPV
jgi:hypothetical protein